MTSGTLQLAAPLEKFKPKDFYGLFGTKGFSDELLKNHFKLYEGYVKNTNVLNEQIGDLLVQGKSETPTFAELKRRFGWEYNGMKLHELYFENFGGHREKQEPSASFREEIKAGFKSWEEWKDNFLGTAGLRGIGWAILYKDRSSGRLATCWIDEHNNGHLVGSEPLLVLDVFEHAFITDYGLDRKKYISSFFDQISWEVVENRAVGE